MHSYEIRILPRDLSGTRVLKVHSLGVHAAIRRAQALAGDGDFIEVWQQMICVYSTAPERALAG